MKKKMIRTAAAAAVMLAVPVIFTACARKPDPEKYVKATLDAVYHRECGTYAELIHISESQAEEAIEKTFLENIETAFEGDTLTSEEDKEAYTNAVREIYKLARYEVTESEETDSGYSVTVAAEPCRIFENLENSVSEKAGQALEEGTYSEEKAVSYVTEYLNEAEKHMEYGEMREVKVNVTKDESGIYQISGDDMLKVENTLFPGAK